MKLLSYKDHVPRWILATTGVVVTLVIFLAATSRLPFSGEGRNLYKFYCHGRAMTPQDSAARLYATWAGGDGKQRKKVFNTHVAVDVSEVESIRHFEFAADTATDNNGDESHVLVLTPLVSTTNADPATLKRYFELLSTLRYNHDSIDLGLLVPAGVNHKALREAAQAEADAIQAGRRPFRSVQIVTKSFDIPSAVNAGSGAITMGGCKDTEAKARNYLLATLLTPRHAYVYWRDVNVVDAPESVIGDLIRANADVVTPNTWAKANKRDGADYRAWAESPIGYKLALGLPKDTVIPAGDRDQTHKTERQYLAAMGEDSLAVEEKDIKESTAKDHANLYDTVDLDAVGTASLLVRADVHRTGIVFPWFPFENQCGSEGFGKMARRADYKVVGLPNYVVWTGESVSIEDKPDSEKD